MIDLRDNLSLVHEISDLIMRMEYARSWSVHVPGSADASDWIRFSYQSSVGPLRTISPGADQLVSMARSTFEPAINPGPSPIVRGANPVWDSGWVRFCIR